MRDVQETMNIRLKEIAATCGVSINTASNILNRGLHDRYSTAVRERVLAEAHLHNYRPLRAAQSMRHRKTHVVGFVAQNFAPEGVLRNYKVHPFLVGMNHCVTRRDYHVGLVELNEVEPAHDRAPLAFREQFFDGLVIHYGLSEQARHQVEQLRIPVLWWDSGHFDATGCIYRDEAQVGRLAAQKLLELGHQRIAFLWIKPLWETYLRRPETLHYSFVQRFESYRDTMRQNGLEEMVVLGMNVGEIAEQMQRLAPTALISFGTDEMMPVVQAACRLGWCVPRDLSLAACDIEARLSPQEMSLGGVLYDRYDAGQKAGAMLLQMLEQPDEPVAGVKLSNTFRAGDTIAPLIR